MLELSSLIFLIKGKHSVGREFQSLAGVRKETVDIDILITTIEYEPRVQERQQVKDQQSYISVFIAYLTFLSSS